VATDSLSQADLDGMLAGTTGGASTAGADAPMDVQLYDFRRPARLSKERMRTLEAMYERMVKELESWVLARVRGDVTVQLQSIEQFTFADFSLSLPAPCSTFIFDIGESGHQGVIDIGPEFGFYVIDRSFGGTGEGTAPMRVLTPIERLALRTVAERVTQLLEDAWRDVSPMALTLSGFESTPEMLQVASREDSMLVANIEVTAANQSSLLLVCLPFAALEQFLSGNSPARAAAAPNTAARAAATAKSEAALREMPVPVSVRLPQFQMRLDELARLDVGTIIPTGLPTDARLIVRAGDEERFVGQAGRVSGMLAVRIVDAIAPKTP
jgi:flagellar motor switch protein FliM